MTLPMPAVQTSSVGPNKLSTSDAIDRAAQIVHTEHDRFSWRHCSHAACRALADALSAGR